MSQKKDQKYNECIWIGKYALQIKIANIFCAKYNEKMINRII
jgi:hypothetical protein